MKYRDISWNLEINGTQASFDDEALDFIAKQIKNGNTSGLFTMDITDYDKIETLKNELEKSLGRAVDFDYFKGELGELNSLLEIAKNNNDNEMQDLIQAIIDEMN